MPAERSPEPARDPSAPLTESEQIGHDVATANIQNTTLSPQQVVVQLGTAVILNATTPPDQDQA